jgi:hypothetical protein
MELINDMQHPFTFLKDKPKYDGSTWVVKIYFFGIALVKHRHKKYYRVVRLSKVKAALLPIFEYDVKAIEINDGEITKIKINQFLKSLEK